MPAFDFTRRQWLMLGGAAVLGVSQPAWAASLRGTSEAVSAANPSDPASKQHLLAAVWQDAGQDWLGMLAVQTGPLATQAALPDPPHGPASAPNRGADAAAPDTLQWHIGARIQLPTRGHGVSPQADGSVLLAARRPGDWLLRWHPRTGEAQWSWMAEDRCFNGHIELASAATAQALGVPAVVLTTETDLDNSQGCIGLRHAVTLEKLGEWRTQGMDPHELRVLAEPVGPYPAGSVVVANGGIPTQSETGRSKKWVSRMDPSLVILHPADGRLLGQWKLPDPRLSVRHLAWDAKRQRMGIALQAEHDQASEQAAAPVLAVWDVAHGLRLAQGQPAVKGYGGSIDCAPGEAGGFVVSCPRADCTAWFDPEGRFVRTVAQPGVYPLALTPGRQQLLTGGGHGVGVQTSAPAWQAARTQDAVSALQFDNHWRAV